MLWRLWYREMATSSSAARQGENDGWKEEAYLDEKMVDNALSSTRDETLPVLPLTPRIPDLDSSVRQLSTTLANPAPRQNSFVGKIIVNMLTNKSLIPTLKCDPSITVLPNSPPTYCPLPTPAQSDETPTSLLMHTPSPPIQLHVQLDVTIDASSPTVPPLLPHVVVVNPTPGPSPLPTPPSTPVLGPALGGGGVAHDKGKVNGNANEGRRFTDKLLMPLPMPMPIFGIQVAPSSPPIPVSSSSSSGRTVVSSSLNSLKSGSGSLPSPAKSDAPLSPLTTVTTIATMETHLDTNVFLLPKGGEKHRSPERASGPGLSMRTAARPDHIRRTGSAGRFMNEKKSATHSSRSTSRSRSRDTVAGAGLAMTNTKRGGKPRVQLGALRRSSSGREGAGVRAVVMRRATLNKEGKEERKPRFDVGSNSDEGTASRNGDVGYVIEEEADGRTRHSVPQSLPKPQLRSPKQQSPPKFRAVPISPTKTTRPPPLSSQLPLPHPEAVIPQLQQRRTTIVLATSESDYEPETDSDSEVRSSGGAGDWSSEEEGEVDVVVRRDASVPQRTQQDAAEGCQPLPLPPSLQQLPPHPTTTTARNGSTTTSHPRPQLPPNQLQSHNPPTHAQHPQHLTRAQLQHQAQAARAQHVVEQAVFEVERRRQMFAKKQVPSAEELAGKHARSVGLLSQLMNPDPEIFPVNHLYRRGFSSGEIRGARPAIGMTAIRGAGPSAGASVSRDAGVVANGVVKTNGRVERGGVLPHAAPPGMHTNNGAAAVPVASQIQAGSVIPGATLQSKGGVGMNGSGSGGYRPKGRPVGQEIEDDSDSDSEGDAQNAMLISKSVAQEKLNALAARGIVTHQQPEKILEEEDPVPQWVQERASTRTNGQASGNVAPTSKAPPPRQYNPMPTPIPVGHPYNLPPPTAPSTLCTTRRLMLQTEMSESLRRNLL